MVTTAASLMSGSIMTPSFTVGPQTDLPRTLLSPSDIEESIAAYEELLRTAKSYRNALAALEQQSNAFGAALEACARLKGVDEAAEGLSNVAGLQYVLANRHSVLSDTVYRSFEIPLRENLENFVVNTEQRRETYAIELTEKKKLLEKRERAHLSLAHKNRRSLDQFREALTDLTQLADGIDKLKSEYFYNCLDDHSETWARVGMRSNIVCKAELSLYSSVAQKAEQLEWSLVGTPDPWLTEVRSGDDLFSIVPPQEILARPQSPAHDGLFRSLLGTIASVDVSPMPVSRASNSETLKHNLAKAASQASFFSRQEDCRGLPAIKGHRIVTDCEGPGVDASMENESFLTPRANQEAVNDSPYQDAEEENDPTTSVTGFRPSTAGTESSEYSTPSRRPTSKRTNSVTHVPKTATRRHPMTTTPKSTPGHSIRPRSSGWGTSDLEREEKASPSKSVGNQEPLSPEDDSTSHWKHSEYSPKKIKTERE